MTSYFSVSSYFVVFGCDVDRGAALDVAHRTRMTTERIRVGVRFRPLSAREIASGSDDGWIYDEEERSVRENDVASLERIRLV